MAKITLKKPYLVEGKVLAKGTKLIIRESDEALDNYEALETSSDTSPNEFDIEKARRLRIARLRKMRAIKKAEGEEEFLDEEEDETLEESDFPSEEILAMRKARRLRLANLKKSEGEEDEGDNDSDEEDDESPVEAMRKARIARIKRMKRMKRNRR